MIHALQSFVSLIPQSRESEPLNNTSTKIFFEATTEDEDATGSENFVMIFAKRLPFWIYHLEFLDFSEALESYQTD